MNIATDNCLIKFTISDKTALNVQAVIELESRKKSFALQLFYDSLTLTKVSVQGVVAIGGHFATLCQEVDFKKHFFPLSIFKKKRQILLHF